MFNIQFEPALKGRNISAMAVRPSLLMAMGYHCTYCEEVIHRAGYDGLTAIADITPFQGSHSL